MADSPVQRLDAALRDLKQGWHLLETTKIEDFVYSAEAEEAFHDVRTLAEEAFADYCRTVHGIDVDVTFFWVRS